MWYKTFNPFTKTKDATAELAKVEGDLDEPSARAAVWEFFWHNPAFMLYLLAKFHIFAFQELMLKGLFRNDYNLVVWSRGAGKSTVAAWFIILWAIANPGCKIVVVSFAFRSARRILEECERFLNRKHSAPIKSAFPKDLSKKADIFSWTLPNESTITALPLGDGTKIRGIRADVLIVDEFAYMPENVIGAVLEPFLAANSNIQDHLTKKLQEDELIAAGKMKEEDRTQTIDRKKVIFLSSACYQFEHMYKKYMDWIGAITDPSRKENTLKSGATYFISRVGWEAIPEGILNRTLIENAKRTTSEALFAREYGAKFTDDSDGYFRAAKLRECSVKDGEGPYLELSGERGAEYVLGIDVSLSGSETSDDFAMCLQKIVTKADGSKIGMIVHNYAVSGGNYKDHTLYLYYLLRNFNVVWIAIDATQGNAVEFLNGSVQSKLFKDAHIDLSDIDADFRKDDYSNLPKEIKRSYNKTAGRIVQKQPFSSAWQRAANEWLQAKLDYRGILFAGKLTSSKDAAINRAMATDISMLHNHETLQNEFKTDDGGMTITNFIEWQSMLLDLTRDECTMVQVKVTGLGTLSFDLPTHVKRAGGADRARKDSYSALLLSTWAVRLYLESQTVEIQQGMPDFPYALIG